MINKKDGFTLIELMAVIGILMIILSISTTSYLYYSKVTEELIEEEFIYAVEEMLLFGKQYSLKNSANLSINIDNINKYIGLIHEGKVIKRVMYSEGIKLENSGGTILKIDSKGVVSPGAIKIKKSNEVLATIKIRVGVDYINVEKK